MISLYVLKTVGYLGLSQGLRLLGKGLKGFSRVP